MVSSDDEVKLAVAPYGSSEKNCWGWEETPSQPQQFLSELPHGATTSFTSSNSALLETGDFHLFKRGKITTWQEVQAISAEYERSAKMHGAFWR